MDDLELDTLRAHMERLASKLEDLGDELDTEVVAGILRMLLNGYTSAAIIDEYGLIDAGV